MEGQVHVRVWIKGHKQGYCVCFEGQKTMGQSREGQTVVLVKSHSVSEGVENGHGSPC